MIPCSKRNPFSGRAGAEQTLLSPPAFPACSRLPPSPWIWARSRGLTGGLWWARWWSAPSQGLAWLRLHLELSSWEMSLIITENPRHRSCHAFSTVPELEQEDVGWRVPGMSPGGGWGVWDGGRGGGEGECGQAVKEWAWRRRERLSWVHQGQVKLREREIGKFSPWKDSPVLRKDKLSSA